MNEPIEAEWEVDRWEADSTHRVEISAEDVEGYDTPEAAIEGVVEDIVRLDFEQTIRWVFAHHETLKEQIQAAIDARKAREAKEEPVED